MSGAVAPAAGGSANAPSSPTLPSLLSSARDLVFVLAILAYFAGFEYRYYFYSRNLHLPVGTFPVIDNQILVGSYSVFLVHRANILSGIGVLLALALAMDILKVQERVWAFKYQRIALFFLILVFFPILNVWAQETANVAFVAFVDTPTPKKPIVVSLKDKRWSAPIAAAMIRGCVELITQTSDSLYLLVRQASTRPYVYVVAVPTAAAAQSLTPLDYPSGNYAKRCIP
jgi:hypothetical protein